MGEIRIKSGNLFDGELEQGSLNSNDGSEVVNNTRIRTVESILLKEGTYTIDCVGATGGVVVCAYNTDDLSYDKAASYVGQWRLLPFTFVVNDERLYRFAFKKEDNSIIFPSEVTNVQLLEGTYTSSTIPEYQPYFLNRPAHKFINGEWIDIPTHHYINNRWQGELTSQSPLEFHATGQSLLDWRIDGASGGVGDWDETEQKYKIPVNVKGGTLFDISDTYSAIPSKYNITNDTISMVLTTDWGGNYIKFNKTYEAGTYTFRANITRDSNMTISLWSNKSFVGSSYNSYYKGYVRAFNGSLQTYTFSEDFRIGFTGSGATGLSGSISDFQILKGTYTSETMPPYESYITNLYTDHQLMDGDSIDYTTTETTIPLATGNNTLMVDTAVQPSKVFVKFEG